MDAPKSFSDIQLEEAETKNLILEDEPITDQDKETDPDKDKDKEKESQDEDDSGEKEGEKDQDKGDSDETDETDQDKKGEKEGDKGGEEEGEEDEGEEEPEKFKIGEDEVTLDEYKELKESQMRLDDYRKKTEELAEIKKSVEPLVSLLEKLKSDESLLADFKDAFIEEQGEDVGKLFEQALKGAEGFKSPLQDEIDKAQAKIDILESEAFIENETKELMKAKKISRDKADKVYDFAVEHFTKTGESIALESAYKLMNFDKVAKEAEEKKKPVPKPPDKSKGVKDIKTKSTPKDFKEIDISEYDVLED